MNEQLCPEHGNSEYVCFKIDRLEFFCKTVNFARHSEYFKKVVQKQLGQQQQQQNNDGEEIKIEQDENNLAPLPQIVIRLSKQTLPSVLILIIKYIEESFIFDGNTVDLDTLFHAVNIADELKMR